MNLNKLNDLFSKNCHQIEWLRIGGKMIVLLFESGKSSQQIISQVEFQFISHAPFNEKFMFKTNLFHSFFFLTFTVTFLF
jgi:hypothetical protein